MRYFNRLRSMAGLQVTVLTLTSLSAAASKLTISPSNPKQLNNSSLQYTATLNKRDVTKLVKWSTSNPVVATIAHGGRATLLTAGTATITAAMGKQKASTTLTVTVAIAPVFSTQPTDTNVSVVIDAGGGVQVKLLDNLGDPLSNQRVTISIGTNPPGTGTLSGTLSRSTDYTGTATFPDLKIDWLGTGYTLTASANPSSGVVSGTSAVFNELRVGDACLGPDTPACSSGCSDTDLDGLNDAWEKAGGVDINGDGVITDSVHDVLLPGADPNVPDIYLKYDYMVAADHSHRPPDRAWDQMRAMFAAHGIMLHVVAPTAGIPEHRVVTLDPEAQPNCAGPDFITMQELRKENFGNLQPAYHYMVFAHDSTTPNDASLVMHCPDDALCGARPLAGANGIADVFGDDAIISDGENVDAGSPWGIELWTSTMMHELGHNFGLAHGSLADPDDPRANYCTNSKPNYISVMNYTYQLGTIVPSTAPGTITPFSCKVDADCSSPNITSGRCSTPNSCFCTDDLGEGNNVCYRPDYAEDTLLNLNETTLDENVGVGGPSSLEDIVFYFIGLGGTLPGASNGSPIDWNNDGAITNLTGCTVGPGPDQCPDLNNDGIHSDQMDTTADWTQVNGQFTHLNFQFQCTQGYQNDKPGAPTVSPAAHSAAVHSFSDEPSEIGFEWARQHHRLHPPRPVAVSVAPGCSSELKPVAAGQFGTVRVALLGTDHVNVDQVDKSSLNFHGVHPINVVMQDVNDDGIQDLLALFDTAAIKLRPEAATARLTGWFKNGQAFWGEVKIRVVSNLMAEDANCR